MKIKYLLEIISFDEKETFNVGLKLTHILRKGNVVSLKGEQGAGKTVFTKGLASGLSINENITSPTFALLNLYNAKLNSEEVRFCHFDLYRLSSEEEAEETGIFEYLDSDDCLSVVEWAENISAVYNACDYYVEIEYLDGNKRKIKIGTGDI